MSVRPDDRAMSCNLITIEGATLVMHPYKAIFWEEEETLIVSDLHLGKVHHFRKAGIFVPMHAAMDNYERLSSLLMEFEPSKLLILGDLFHSSYNQDWQTFSDLRHTFSAVAFMLILGNHDILDLQMVESNNIQVQQALKVGPFSFSHFPSENEGLYNIAGHLHPGVRLIDASKQSLRLSCFCFGTHQALLPAFGTFTGTSLIKPNPGDRVFVVSEDQLAEVTL